MIALHCDDALEQIDAYALGALDADETAALEAHLVECADCRAALAAARETAASVALAAPLTPAPAALKARVLASASVLSTERPPRRRSAVVRWWPAAAAAALIALSAGAMTWGAFMQREVNDLRGDNRAVTADATAAAQQLALARDGQAGAAAWQDGMLAIASAGDLKRTEMTGTALAPNAEGRYVWSANAQLGAFLGTGLPDLPANETYQFWFVYGDKWEDAGTCTAAGGRATLIVRRGSDGDEAASSLRGFAVTIEPKGGSTERTGAMVLQSSLN